MALIKTNLFNTLRYLSNDSSKIVVRVETAEPATNEKDCILN